MRKPEQFINHPSSFQGGRYRAFCTYIVDADTFDFLVDLGLYQYAYITVRLENVDAPEIRGEERLAGSYYKEWARQILLDKPCVLVTQKDTTTFGRFVADVEYWDDPEWKSFAQHLKNKLDHDGWGIQEEPDES